MGRGLLWVGRILLFPFRPLLWAWRRFAGGFRRLRDAEPEPPPPPPSSWVFMFIGVVVVLAANIGYLTLDRDTPPGPPYLPVDEVEEVDPAVFDHDRGILFLDAGPDGIRALVAPEEVELVYCEQSDQVEASDGRVWDVQGRSLDGGESLTVRPIRIFDETFYMNPQETASVPPGTDRVAEPGCVEASPTPTRTPTPTPTQSGPGGS